MSSVYRFGYQNAQGETVDDADETFDRAQAIRHAQARRLRVVAHEYEYADTVVIADFTPEMTAGH
jgi:hypothetical protein